MKRVGVMLLLVVAACAKNGFGDDDYPVTPPGGGGGDIGAGGGGTGDGGIDAALDDAGNPIIVGRVCLLTDLRDAVDPVPAMKCATTGATGITVTLGSGVGTGAMETTGANGTFQISKRVGADIWTVLGGPAAAPVFTSVMPLADGDVIPVMRLADYTELSPVPLQDDQGAIVVRVVNSSSKPVVDANVTLTPQSPNQTYYDGTSATTWDTDRTGMQGIAWFPGVPVRSEAISVTPMMGQVETVTVTAQAIRFVTIPVGP